jgi:hypothetical protein
MIQQSVLDKSGYSASSTVTSAPVFNPFADCTDDLVSEDDDVIAGTSLIPRNPTSRNGVSLGREPEPADRGESPVGIEGRAYINLNRDGALVDN